MATSIDNNADNVSKDLADLSIVSNKAWQIEYNQNDENDLLGKGSNGTLVFRGKYKWKVADNVEAVAIKQIVKQPGSDFSPRLKREVKALQSLDNENVIKYIDVEVRESFVLIALQLCLGSLVNIVTPGHKKDIDGNSFRKYKTNQWSTKKTLLKGAANGLDYIHKNNILHRDLKPQNVLVTVDGDNKDSLKAVISDFGLCREFKTGEFNPSHSLIGSRGWMPKEILLKKKNLLTPTAVDVFAFGCIIHYLMSFERSPDKIHPFGEDDVRNQNIKKPDRVTYLYENMDSKHTFYGDTILVDILIDVCVSFDPKIRPTADEISKHPFFWSYTERIQYVCKHFNSFKDYPKSQRPAHLTKLQSLWEDLRSCKEFHNDIPEVWKYVDVYNKSLKSKKTTPDHWKSNIFDGLMRTIRNVPEHWTSAVLLHPPLNALFGIPDLKGNTVCDHEEMGIYFFEKIPQSFPIIYASFMSQDALKSNDTPKQKKDLEPAKPADSEPADLKPADLKEIKERQKKIYRVYNLSVQTLKRVLIPANLEPANLEPANLEPANLEPADLKPGCS